MNDTENSIVAPAVEIDMRIRNLSYSSLLDFHACPRKFQLDRLNAVAKEEDPNSIQSVTFAFGHAVGEGIQLLLEGKSWKDTLLSMYLNWKPDLAVEDEKRKKSLYLAIAAVKKFYIYFTSQGSKLSQYELVYTENAEGVVVPAIELPFIIEMPDGFLYRGKVDAVLRHKRTGAILVLELKTSSAKFVDAAMYKNSAQAIGYSIVLDALFPGYSSYSVFYMIYLTGSMEYSIMEFNKSKFQRAAWLQELLLDVEVVKLYERTELYPMRGESCFNYYSPCKYFDVCTLTTSNLVKPLTPELAEQVNKRNNEYYIRITFADLINSQFACVEETETIEGNKETRLIDNQLEEL